MITATALTAVKQPAIRDIIGGALSNQAVSVRGMVHALRDMGGLTFLLLRKGDGVLQCVCPPEVDLDGVTEECAVEVLGTVHKEARAPGGAELAAAAVRVLSRPAAPMPVPVSKWKLNLTLDSRLSLRPAVLRSLRERSVFRIQAGICRAFREYLQSQDFTEIHTPKIVHAGAEGGSNIFRLDYFGRKAFLTQSPSSTSRPWCPSLSGCLRWVPCSGRRSTAPPAT